MPLVPFKLGFLLAVLLPLAACSPADQVAPDADESSPTSELGSELRTDLSKMPPCELMGGCVVDLPVTRPIVYRFWGSSANDVWAVGKNSLTMNWNGTNWRRFGNPGSNDLWAVWGTASNDVWAVGDGATILHWNGMAWSKAMGLPVTSGFNDVWGTSASDVWAVGNSGGIVRWDGTKWSQVSTSYINGFMTVWAASASDVWIGGEAGLLLRWDGAKLNEVGTDTVATVWRIRGSTPGKVYMTADDSKLRIWDGAKWAVSTEASGIELWVVNDKMVWSLPLRSIAVYFWNGILWTSRSRRLAGDSAAIWATDKDGWLCDFNGNINRYNGTEWNPF